jgi:hypothetical protein
MKSKGWVKLWRLTFDHALLNSKPWCDGYAWCYLFSRANHDKGVVNFRNEYIELERGQFLTSQIQLSEKWGWTRKHVKKFLFALENDKMLTTRTTNRYIIVTICNYEIYQSNEYEKEQQVEQQATQQKRNRRPNSDPQTRSKEEKNIYNIYGKFVKLTDEEYSKLIKKFTKPVADDWIERTNLYAEKIGANKFKKKYISHYATILFWSRMENERKGIASGEKEIINAEEKRERKPDYRIRRDPNGKVTYIREKEVS